MEDINNSQISTVKSILSKLKYETMTQVAYIKTEAKHTGLFDSKFGGIPYLPKGAEIPKDSEGHQLTLLAQINCNDIKGMKDFPNEGILQFFVLNDDESGLMDFNDQSPM